MLSSFRLQCHEKKFLFYFLFISFCSLNIFFFFSKNGGWVCKYGSYGTGPCPYPPQAGVCPTFNTVLNSIGCINNNGIDAALTTGVDRHTIMDTNAYGTGIDPNSVSPYLIHVVDSGGGNYSFRIGDAVTGGTNLTPNYTGTCNGPGCYARAEAIRLTFAVTAQNSSFTYRYAAFLAGGGHLPEEQPRFEVLITRPNAGDLLISGLYGYLKIVANNSNPYCPGGNFHNGVTPWFYTDWTSVTTDLTNYIGQQIAVEFRTSDCFPGSGIQTVFNGVCTTTIQNGDSCLQAQVWLCVHSGQCYGTPVCSNTPGSHSAYAYIDVDGFPFFDGINELHNNVSISIYPNPMTSSSIIEINGEQNAEVEIYDMVGKLLLRKKLVANKTEIQKGDLAQGIYLVKVNQYIKKLVVE